MRLNTYGTLEGAADILKYRAAYGYEPASTEVIFLNNEYLREEEGPEDIGRYHGDRATDEAEAASKLFLPEGKPRTPRSPYKTK